MILVDPFKKFLGHVFPPMVEGSHLYFEIDEICIHCISVHASLQVGRTCSIFAHIYLFLLCADGDS